MGKKRALEYKNIRAKRTKLFMKATLKTILSTVKEKRGQKALYFMGFSSMTNVKALGPSLKLGNSEKKAYG